MTRCPVALALVLFPALGCGNGEPGAAAAQSGQSAVGSPAPVCQLDGSTVALPVDVPESSGLARGARTSELLWTHNDAGNAPELFAVDGSGALVQRVLVRGAQLVDWEDIDAAPCGEESCLYIGDIGDNDGERDHITVYRLVEPVPGAGVAQEAEPLHARYPDGPQDAEALFVDGAGTLYVVTKGRRGPVTLYRWPSSAPGQTVTLERVRTLFPEPADDADRVTAASATPDGRWVGIRTYRSLYLYRADALLGSGQVRSHTVNLGMLKEPQGEALALANDGTIWVSSEAEDGGRARMARLKCAFPGESTSSM